MRFWVILALVQGWSNQGWYDALFWLCWNWFLKVDLGTHLRDKHGHLFLWDLVLYCPSFKVGQTNVENIPFLSTFLEFSLESGLGTHLIYKHGHLFLWDLELFWLSFNVGETKVEIMHFYRLSRNWNFKVDLDLEICCPSF